MEGAVFHRVAGATSSRQTAPWRHAGSKRPKNWRWFGQHDRRAVRRDQEQALASCAASSTARIQIR
jgi:hypothetical protein